MIRKLTWIVCMLICGLGFSQKEKELIVSSPDNQIQLQFLLTANKQPAYLVFFKNEKVVDTSTLGFDLKNTSPLKENFKILNTTKLTHNDTWEMVWGEDATVVNHYNGLKIELQETSSLKRKLNLVFKVYNDGLGFRYEFPDQMGMKEVIITNENTEFNLTGDHQVWWTPGDWDIYEYLYNTTPLSKINAIKYYEPDTHQGQTFIPENAVNTPVTMKTKSGLHLSFHEADLTDYAGMTLKIDTVHFKMQTELVGNRDGDKVIQKTPFVTPWRTIQLADTAGDLITSKLILNLNDPNTTGKIPYFHPMKYLGIWWDMHLGTGSWDLGGKHAATTGYAKEMIDFASLNNIGGLLVEGWNIGWEKWWNKEEKEVNFDFVTPYPDYDLKEVVAYGKSKNVALIMHHETSADAVLYEKQLDTAYALMQQLGIHAVKTGYVSTVIPKGEYHHGQWMVNHYQKVLEKGMETEVVIDAHEPIMATGKRRTYPVAISREGVRGQEYNAWAEDGGNPPEHLTIVPFTRMLAGPIDYTPGIFNTTLKPYRPNNQINSTLAYQLALYVVIYSPIQMVPDLLPHYRDHPAFQFIKDVGVDWKQTQVLNGEIGDFITIARQEKQTNNWFVGSITDENPREIELKLDFLEKGKTYIATIYADAEDAHYLDNPETYTISGREVNSTTVLHLKLAAGGGCAISLKLKK